MQVLTHTQCSKPANKIWLEVLLLVTCPWMQQKSVPVSARLCQLLAEQGRLAKDMQQADGAVHWQGRTVVLPIGQPLHLHHDPQGVLLLVYKGEDEDWEQQLHEPLKEQGPQEAAEVQL